MKYITTSIVFVVLLLSASCSKEEEPVLIYSDSDISIELFESRKNLRFYIDIISDTSNELDSLYPDFDYCSLLFDVNNNKELDSMIDFKVSILADQRICETFLLTQNSTTPCNLAQDIKIANYFEGSLAEPTPHVQWEFTIPKNRFPEDRANLRVKTTDNSKRRTFPPHRPHQPIEFIFLDNGFEFSW